LMKYENKIFNIEDINKLIIKKAYNRNHKYSLSYEKYHILLWKFNLKVHLLLDRGFLKIFTRVVEIFKKSITDYCDRTIEITSVNSINWYD
jgi:hypothetical protein